MQYLLEDATRILRRTPRTLSVLLTGLPESWTHATEGPDTWSPYDVVGHLIHGERTDWIARARMMLDNGESRTTHSAAPTSRPSRVGVSPTRSWTARDGILSSAG